MQETMALDNDSRPGELQLGQPGRRRRRQGGSTPSGLEASDQPHIPQLQSRLLRTYHDARTYIEEQGVNVLFLALGMLAWYEDEQSKVPRRAPYCSCL